MQNKNLKRPRPTVEDLLRAGSMAVLALWAVLFMLFPPIAFESATEVVTRLTWTGFCFVGAFLAVLGSLLRIDIKMEFPGLLLGIIGPLIYASAQLYLLATGYVSPTANPNSADPTGRIALSAFAVFTVSLMLPRLWALWTESKRLKRINQNATTKIRLGGS